MQYLKHCESLIRCVFKYWLCYSCTCNILIKKPGNICCSFTYVALITKCCRIFQNFVTKTLCPYLLYGLIYFCGCCLAGDDEDYDEYSSGNDNDQHSGSNVNDKDLRSSSDIDTEDDFQMFTPPRLAPTHRPIEFITKRPVATVPTVQGRPTMRSWYSSDSSGGTTAFTLASASRLLTLLSVVAVTLPSSSRYVLSTAGASFSIAVLLIFLS